MLQQFVGHESAIQVVLPVVAKAFQNLHRHYFHVYIFVKLIIFCLWLTFTIVLVFSVHIIS